jgi:hypothetical protein
MPHRARDDITSTGNGCRASLPSYRSRDNTTISYSVFDPEIRESVRTDSPLLPFVLFLRKNRTLGPSPFVARVSFVAILPYRSNNCPQLFPATSYYTSN